MFAYPMYQTLPMYTYSPEEYYYPSGNETSYHPHYAYEDSNRSNQRKRRSSIKKLRRGKSLSKMDYNDEYNNNCYNHRQRNHGEDEYYYQSRNRLDGVRSVSPYTENRGYHHPSLNSRMHPDNQDIVTPRRRNSWVQPTSFINLGQPMINPMTNNYQIQQSLGVRATDTWPGMTTNTYISPHTNTNNDLFFLPQNVPMIQPYYMPPLTNNSNPFLPSASSASSSSYYPQQQQQAALFPNFTHMPILFPEIFPQSNTTSDTNNEVKEETQDISKDVTPNTSQKNSPIVTTKEVNEVTDTTQQPNPAKHPVVLRRKKSFMEEILSSFSLLGEDRKVYYK